MEGWELAGDLFWLFFADGFHGFQPMPLTRIRCKSPDLLAEPDILYTTFKRPHRIYTGRWNTKWRPRGKEETWRKSEERQGVGENWGSMSKTQLQWNPSMSCSPVDYPFAGLTLTFRAFINSELWKVSFDHRDWTGLGRIHPFSLPQPTYYSNVHQPLWWLALTLKTVSHKIWPPAQETLRALRVKLIQAHYFIWGRNEIPHHELPKGRGENR